MTKQEQAYQYLRERILSGVYRPGHRLVLARLAEELNMSEIPVREAIKRLEAEHLVQYDSYIGPVVAIPTNQEIIESLELLAYLEGLATSMAVPHLTDEHLNRLEQIVDDMKKAAKEKDAAAYQQLNKEFHSTIYESTPNQVLLRMITNLFNHTERLWAGEPKRLLLFSDQEHVNQSLQDHEQILRALQIGDAQTAEVLVRNHKRAANRRMGLWVSTWNRGTSAI